MALTWIRTHDWDAEDWRDRAACRDTSPELFFPIGTTGLALDQIDAAKQRLRRVPGHAAECLEFALGDEPGGRRVGRHSPRTSAAGCARALDVATSPRRLARLRLDRRLQLDPRHRDRNRARAPTCRCRRASRSSRRARSVTSACTIERPSPRDALERELLGQARRRCRGPRSRRDRRRGRASRRPARRALLRGTRGRPRSASAR